MKKWMLFVCSERESSRGFYKSLAEGLVPASAQRLISSHQDFHSLIHNTAFSETSHCIIEAELDWSGKNPGDFFGFDVAKSLRRSGLACGIFFCTYWPEEAFSVQKARFSLLQAPNWHQLIFLPTGLETFRKLPEVVMTQNQWEDVVDSLTDVRSLVQEVLHDLKNGVILPAEVISAEDKKCSLSRIVAAKFQQLLLILPEKEKELEKVQAALMSKILAEAETEGVAEYQEIIEQFTPEITQLAPEPEEKEETPLTRSTPWKVLFVDDEPQIRAVMAEGFKQYSINYELAGSGEQALDMLASDTRNTITVLICDIRLKDMKTGVWQKLQGYDIIDQARHMPNYLAFTALTSARKRLKRLQQQQQSSSIVAFYKKDILESPVGMGVFSQKIRELGNMVFFKSRNKPVSTSWRIGNRQRYGERLGLYYKAHLFSSDYDEAEQEINLSAERFVANILEGTSKLNPEISFTGTFKKPPTDPEALDKFRQYILTGRRIALALYLVGGYSKEEVFKSMLPKTEFTGQMLKLLFNTTFCLSFQKDLPDKRDIDRGYYLGARLLQEEIQWLVERYRVNLELSTLQQNREAIESVAYLLDDLRDLLSEKQPKSAEDRKKLNAFLNDDLRDLTIVNYSKLEEKIKEADKLAIHFDVQKKFHEYIKLDLEDEIPDPRIKNMLLGLLKN